jgi:hypothetical protein
MGAGVCTLHAVCIFTHTAVFPHQNQQLSNVANATAHGGAQWAMPTCALRDLSIVRVVLQAIELRLGKWAIE